MPRENQGVVHGRWGEQVAADYLRKLKWTILERNVRPLARDRRYEIDLVAYDPLAETLVFVEVKQHRTHTCGYRRLRSITKDKRRCLRLACQAWRHTKKWQGSYRFDVIEVYGQPEVLKCEIDHIQGVNLFVQPERFVKWST